MKPKWDQVRIALVIIPPFWLQLPADQLQCPHSRYIIHLYCVLCIILLYTKCLPFTWSHSHSNLNGYSKLCISVSLSLWWINRLIRCTIHLFQVFVQMSLDVVRIVKVHHHGLSISLLIFVKHIKLLVFSRQLLWDIVQYIRSCDSPHCSKGASMGDRTKHNWLKRRSSIAAASLLDHIWDCLKLVLLAIGNSLQEMLLVFKWHFTVSMQVYRRVGGLFLYSQPST